MSKSMDVDVDELRSATARIAAQHDAIAHQAQSVEAFQAGPATTGRDYAAQGARYAGLMRGDVIQALQEFAAEVRLVASTLTATVDQYVSTERGNSSRLSS